MTYDDNEGKLDPSATPMDETDLCALIDHERANGIGIED
jgi:hypothetical protein